MILKRKKIQQQKHWSAENIQDDYKNYILFSSNNSTCDCQIVVAKQ